LPEGGGGAVAAMGCPYGRGGAPATVPAGAPQAVQNCVLGGRAVPHLVQKLATVFSL
jgi:hypothetical protein